jgi:hypothetical protein
MVGLLLLSANMQKGLSHDEHMYVAGGDLLARGLGMPYRDYPYLQMPNLAFIYAGLFKVSSYLLLSARLFSTLSALGTLMLVFYTVYDWLRDVSYLVRFIVAAGSVLLIINSPIFVYTSGQAWNHDAALLFCMGALALYSHSARWTSPKSKVQSPKFRWPLVMGLLAGLAVGTRLLFVFAVPVFALALIMLPSNPPAKQRLRLLALYLGGVLLGVLPSLCLFLLAPGQFLYGNFVYHQANGAFWERIGYTRAMDPIGKLTYLWEVITEPATLLLVTGLLVFAIAVVVTRVYRVAGERREFYLVPMLVLALLAGVFVPDPTWYQYFFAPLPFVVLCVAYCAALLYKRLPWSLALFIALTLASFAFRQPFYPVENLFAPDTWATVKAHKMGEEIKRHVASGRVLTFAPIYPLEGGASIYTDFATGPFTWRSITFLSDAERAASGLMSPPELDSLLASDPPGAILVGFEPDLEGHWIEFAQGHAYKEIALGDGATLWVAP